MLGQISGGLQEHDACLFAGGNGLLVPNGGLHLTDMAAFHQKHAQSRLSDAAADGEGQFAVEEHFMEGQVPSFLAMRHGQLAGHGVGIDADAHG